MPVTLCVSSGPLKSRHQDEIKHGEGILLEKIGRELGNLEETSDHIASLSLPKAGEGEELS